MTAIKQWHEAPAWPIPQSQSGATLFPLMKYRVWLNLFPLTLFGMAMLACFGGCGSGPELAGVRGTVQYDGKPLTDGKVLFTSVEHTQPAVGQINPDGTYVLSTVRPEDGATPGKYTVSVVTDLKVRGRQLHVMCSGPAQLLLEVEADKENTIDIDIRQNSGWKLAADD